jgi:hypothetical protein
MISQETLQSARRTAEELRQRGQLERAQAIESLVEAAREDAIPPLDLLTSREAGSWWASPVKPSRIGCDRDGWRAIASVAES